MRSGRRTGRLERGKPCDQFLRRICRIKSLLRSRFAGSGERFATTTRHPFSLSCRATFAPILPRPYTPISFDAIRVFFPRRSIVDDLRLGRRPRGCRAYSAAKAQAFLPCCLERIDKTPHRSDLIARDEERLVARDQSRRASRIPRCTGPSVHLFGDRIQSLFLDLHFVSGFFGPKMYGDPFMRILPKNDSVAVMDAGRQRHGAGWRRQPRSRSPFYASPSASRLP